MHSVRQMFDTDMRLCYACLYPKFEWFDKEFSIEKLIEPQYALVTDQSIFPEVIDNADKFLLSSIGFDGVIRKYCMVVELDNGEKFKSSLFENSKREIVLVHENHVTVGTNLNDVRETFYRKIIRVKSDLDFDGTVIIHDENFEIFKSLYTVAYDLYPEEVIKTHDKTQKNV